MASDSTSSGTAVYPPYAGPSAPTYNSPPGDAWKPEPPPYTTEAPPGYDVPCQATKAPSYGTPVIIQSGAGSHSVVRVQGVTLDSPYVTLKRPNSHMGLAIFSCIFCNWILGLLAIFFSANSQATPNYDIAQGHAKTSLILSLVGMITGIIIYITVLAIMLS